MGDHSDNIPGVPGVGEKTALELVQRYGTIANLYEHVDEIKGKMQEKLINGRESAELSHWLATIVTDAPLDSGDFSQYRFSENIPYRAKKLMEGYEFRKLIDRFTFSDPDAEEIAVSEAQNMEITTLPDLKTFISECVAKKQLAFYVAEDRVEIACDERKNAVVRYAYDLFGETLSLETILRESLATMRKEGMHVCLFDVKKNYRLFDLDPEELFPSEDVMLMAYIADCGEYYEDPIVLLRRY